MKNKSNQSSQADGHLIKVGLKDLNKFIEEYREKICVERIGKYTFIKDKDYLIGSKVIYRGKSLPDNIVFSLNSITFKNLIQLPRTTRFSAINSALFENSITFISDVIFPDHYTFRGDFKIMFCELTRLNPTVRFIKTEFVGFKKLKRLPDNYKLKGMECLRFDNLEKFSNNIRFSRTIETLYLRGKLKPGFFPNNFRFPNTLGKLEMTITNKNLVPDPRVFSLVYRELTINKLKELPIGYRFTNHGYVVLTDLESISHGVEFENANYVILPSLLSQLPQVCCSQ